MSRYLFYISTMMIGLMANISSFAYTTCYWDPDLQETVCAPDYDDSVYVEPVVGGYYPFQEGYGPYIQTGSYPWYGSGPWYGGVWHHGGWNHEWHGNAWHGGGFHSWHH